MKHTEPALSRFDTLYQTRAARFAHDGQRFIAACARGRVKSTYKDPRAIARVMPIAVLAVMIALSALPGGNGRAWGCDYIRDNAPIIAEDGSTIDNPFLFYCAPNSPARPTIYQGMTL